MKQSDDEVLSACASADWVQVVLNGGPPCFHVEDGRFCFRAQRWAGHGLKEFHGFVPLLDFVRALPEIPCCPVHENLLRRGELRPLGNCFVCIRNQRDELLVILRDVMTYIEDGTLVRDIRIDGDPGFVMRQIRFVTTLSKAKIALDGGV